jgi:APA family basic amino acid/polyamine antiporter
MSIIVSRGAEAPSGHEAPLDRPARKLGLPSATALVIGSIIGTGVFTMPAVMAGAGTSSIFTLVAISIGAILLGLMFGQLTKRVPHNEGGLYAYARHEFGDFAGYLTAWCYWITCWAGNAAIVSSWVLYVESLFGIDNPSAWTNFGIAMTGLWIPAAINLAGVRQMAWFQNLTVVLKFLPLLFVGTVGFFFVEKANFGPFNASGGSLYDAVNMAAGVALFSFIGVECASIAAGRVKNPRRNVGRASVIGTAASALLYVAVTAAVMGLVPHGKLVDDGAPFVAAFNSMFSGGWVGKMVALVAVISGIGALNGWTMVTAEMPYAAAKDGLFPQQFSKENRSASWSRPRSPRPSWPGATAVRPASRCSPTSCTCRSSRSPSRTSSRPAPSWRTWCPAAVRCTPGLWSGTSASPASA